MRKRFVAGNWKMFNGPKSTHQFMSRFALELSESATTIKAINENKLEVAIFPPSISLVSAVKSKGDVPLIIGAQNMYWKEDGAFTGEISAKMLLEADCSHVIIGHSERRNIFGETASLLNKKLLSAIEAGLISLFCVGELLQDRKAENTFDVIKKQLLSGLKDIDPQVIPNKVIIAYEPVWAIGTGITASNKDAQEVCSFIRGLISEQFGKTIADTTIILYGGSVKPDNVSSFISEDDIDGVLVGGASLKTETFMDIIKAIL